MSERVNPTPQEIRNISGWVHSVAVKQLGTQAVDIIQEVMLAHADLLSRLEDGSEIPEWKGWWDKEAETVDSPEPWETWTLWAHGQEAGDMREATWADVLAVLGLQEDDLDDNEAAAEEATWD